METNSKQEMPKQLPQKAETFFKGSVVLSREISPVTESASKYLDSMFERMQNGKKADFIFDIDGVLTEISLETAANPKTVDTWAAENKEAIEHFRDRVISFKKTGNARMSICTGRAWDYSKRIVNLLFPEGTLDYGIVEGGAMIVSKPDKDKDWVLTPAKSIDQESLQNLDDYRAIITKHAIGEMGGALEPKKIRLTFNPPKGTTGEVFKEKIKEYLKSLGEENPQDKEKLEKISKNITHTPTTVEIMPSGIDKLLTLEEMLGGNMPIYFGDANTDLSAMKNKNEFKVNVAPLNAENSVKDYVKGDKEAGGFFGLLAFQNDIKGVNKAMDLMYAHYRRLKIFPSKEK